MNGKSIWEAIRSWIRGSEADEPVMHITTKGGWYTDAEKLMRSPKTQELLKKAEPVIKARIERDRAGQSSGS